MRTWLLLLAACGSSGDSKPSPKPTAPVAPAAAPSDAADPWQSSADPSIPAAPKLAVVSHGAEPRQVLTYTVGQLQRTVSFDVVDDGMHVRMAYTLSCTPCRYQMTAFSIGGDATQMATLAKGVSGSIDTSPDGTATVSASLVKTTPSTSSLFETAIVRFPTEPIGVGAKWSVGTPTKSTVYTLRKLTEGGVQVELAGFEGNGDAIAHMTGTLTVSFDDLVARGTLQQRTAIKLGGGATHEQTIDVTIGD